MADTPEAKRLHTLATLIQRGETRSFRGPLRVGVDLGTANIALVVVDSKGEPIAGMTYPSNVVKDGVVVDYLAACRVVGQLKAALEQQLGITLTQAATAIPPGISVGNSQAIVNVVEAAGFRVTQVVDEPVAAATALNIRDGAVVDIGGGTTGMSILQRGKVTFSADEPTGGTHMTLVLAGSLNISYAEAEEIKKSPLHETEIFSRVQPVAEKMASLVANWLTQHPAKKIWLVGGASSFSQFADVFRTATGKEVIAAPQPLLVTPLGIALHSMR